MRKVYEIAAENNPRDEDEVYLKGGNRNNDEMRIYLSFNLTN